MKWYRENKKRAIALSTAWRKKNRDRYLLGRRAAYQLNKGEFQEKARIRSAKYYHEVHKLRRQENPAHYKELDRQRSARQYVKRKALLLELRNEMGGKCSKCGYCADIRILTFHHTDKNKLDNVSNILILKKIREEAKKCILLCPNCHAIEHLNEP